MIPEEDRGPAWLRDYSFTDFGNIAADMHAMRGMDTRNACYRRYDSAVQSRPLAMAMNQLNLILSDIPDDPNYRPDSELAMWNARYPA